MLPEANLDETKAVPERQIIDSRAFSKTNT
jgi:hypothetical protein